jgi:hypothetical protein
MQQRAVKLLSFIGDDHKSTKELIEGLQWTQAAVEAGLQVDSATV